MSIFLISQQRNSPALLWTSWIQMNSLPHLQTWFQLDYKNVTLLQLITSKWSIFGHYWIAVLLGQHLKLLRLLNYVGSSIAWGRYFSCHPGYIAVFKEFITRDLQGSCPLAEYRYSESCPPSQQGCTCKNLSDTVGLVVVVVGGRDFNSIMNFSKAILLQKQIISYILCMFN